MKRIIYIAITLTAALLYASYVIVPHHHHDEILCLIKDICSDNCSANDTHSIHHENNEEDSCEDSCLLQSRSIASLPENKIIIINSDYTCFPEFQLPDFINYRLYDDVQATPLPDCLKYYRVILYYKSSPLAKQSGLRAPPEKSRFFTA